MLEDVPEFPRLEVRSPVVFAKEPSVEPVTSALKEQLPPAATVPPV
ncbi:MAG: hypothetical protein Rhob2KO_54720 [Rhodopirellula baltica]